MRKSLSKVVRMKFLAMHITNQKLSFDIFTVGNLQNIIVEHRGSLLNILTIFGIKYLIFNLTHTIYCIALNMCYT